jgi:hypothetical protein
MVFENNRAELGGALHVLSGYVRINNTLFLRACG